MEASANKIATSAFFHVIAQASGGASIDKLMASSKELGYLDPGVSKHSKWPAETRHQLLNEFPEGKSSTSIIRGTFLESADAITRQGECVRLQVYVKPPCRAAVPCKARRDELCAKVPHQQGPRRVFIRYLA